LFFESKIVYILPLSCLPASLRLPVELLVNVLLKIAKQKNIDAYNLLATTITIYGNKVLNFKEKDAQINKLLNILEK